MAQLRADIPTNPAQARHGLSDLLAAFELAAGAGEVGKSDWLALADCFFDLGEFTGAIEIMERVLGTYGEDPMVSLKIIIALARRGLRGDLQELPAKLRALTPLLPLDRGTLDWDTVQELIWKLVAIDHGEAEKFEDKWMQLDSDNPRAWLGVARLALDRTEWKWDGRPSGWVASKRKRGRQHLIGARRSLQGPDATDPKLWRDLYLLQARAGMIAESVESAGTFYRLAPQNRDAMLQILKLYPKHPKIAGSAEIDQIVTRLLTRESEPAAYWHDLAILCGGAGRMAEKRTALQHCLTLEPNNQLVRLALRNVDVGPQIARRMNTPDVSGQSATKHHWWRRAFARHGGSG